jgi:glycosyltransferase involved in cell wall biosynthesis
MGLIGARQDTVGTVGRTILRSAIRSLNTSQTYYVFENPEDAETLGLNASRGDRLTLVGGAGVSLEAFEPSVLPPQPPLKVAVVARMLWSKGIDLAVSAVEQARSRGAPVELSLYGAPDPGNPKAIPEETLRAWNALPGIRWHGPVADVGAVWRLHHVACLPSRGGEGLPRTLLESAAAGRAIVTTDVPGCRRLVRDGVQGFVVPPEDDSALADALVRLASDSELVARMAAAGRERIAEGFTERAVMNQIQQVYLQAFA